MESKKNKVLITGATGFIGNALLQELSKTNHEIICVVRDDNDVSILDKVGIKQFYFWNELEKIKKIDFIIHLAGVVNARSQQEFYDGNVNTTKKILEFADKKKVKKIIFLGTAVASSDSKEVYAKTKLIAENLIKESKIDYVILRASLVYGKGDKRHIGALINFVNKFLIIPIAGNGKYFVQPVFIGDLVGVLSTIVFDKKIVNKTYVIAGPTKISFNEMIDTISSVLNKRRFKLHLPSKFLIILSGVYEKIIRRPKVTKEQISRITQDKIYDITPAIKDLDFNPIDFKQGLIKVIGGEI